MNDNSIEGVELRAGILPISVHLKLIVVGIHGQFISILKGLLLETNVEF